MGRQDSSTDLVEDFSQGGVDISFFGNLVVLDAQRFLEIEEGRLQRADALGQEVDLTLLLGSVNRRRYDSRVLV